MPGNSTPNDSAWLSNPSLASGKARQEEAALDGGPGLDLCQVDSDGTVGSGADEIRRAVPVSTQLPLNLGLRVLAYWTQVDHGLRR